jgi:hypothetical protein
MRERNQKGQAGEGLSYHQGDCPDEKSKETMRLKLAPERSCCLLRGGRLAHACPPLAIMS